MRRPAPCAGVNLLLGRSPAKATALAGLSGCARAVPPAAAAQPPVAAPAAAAAAAAGDRTGCQAAAVLAEVGALRADVEGRQEAELATLRQELAALREERQRLNSEVRQHCCGKKLGRGRAQALTLNMPAETQPPRAALRQRARLPLKDQEKGAGVCMRTMACEQAARVWRLLAGCASRWLSQAATAPMPSTSATSSSRRWRRSEARLRQRCSARGSRRRRRVGAGRARHSLVGHGAREHRFLRAFSMLRDPCPAALPTPSQARPAKREERGGCREGQQHARLAATAVHALCWLVRQCWRCKRSRVWPGAARVQPLVVALPQLGCDLMDPALL